MSAAATASSNAYCLSQCVQSPLLWCRRQTARIFSPLPKDGALKELIVRILIVATVLIPLLGLLAMCCGVKAVPSWQVRGVFPAKVPPWIYPNQRIEDGYGEFMFRYRNEPGRGVDLETYEKLFPIQERFQIVRWSRENPGKSSKERLEQLQQAVQRIDPNLEAVFVPRTLYELVWIEKSMQEDLEKVRNFSFQNPDRPTKQEEEQLCRLCFAHKNSWLNVVDILEGTWQEGRLMNVGHRLNEALRVLCQHQPSALTVNDIRHLVQEMIDSIKQCTKDAGRVANCAEPGPLSHFSTESTRGSLRPMKLASPEMEEILRQSVRLECALFTRGKVLLYRGGSRTDDFPIHTQSTSCWAAEESEKCYSLSYGTSPFAGIVRDAGATAFHFMRTQAKDAYVLVVDPLAQDLFFLPETTGLRSLFEKGEYFHGRSKAYVLEKGELVGGIKDGSTCPYEDLPRTHKSKLPRNLFIDLFQKAMNRGFLLKSAAT